MARSLVESWPPHGVGRRHLGTIREYTRRIARAIVARRAERPFERTADLAALIASVAPRGEGRIHPATRAFQAIRIHVNRELEDLHAGLAAAHDALRPGGRLVVISFHSLEDRIAKQFIAKHSRDEVDRRALFAAPKPTSKRTQPPSLMQVSVPGM